MSTTAKEIYNQIIQEKESHSNLDVFDSVSEASRWKTWSAIVAIVMAVQYKFFELFKVELDQEIRSQKLYTLPWFRQAALDYRHGHPLDDATGQFIGTGYTEEEIEASKIVAQAAVIELELNNRKHLFVKCAKLVNGKLAKLSDEEQDGVVQYFARIKPAGTKIIVFTGNADDLRITIDFYYDPLILDENGARIDGSSNTPVQDTLRNYLSNLKFNGEFNIAILEDKLQEVEGCAEREAYVRECEVNYKTPVDFQTINSNYVANSGYMEVDDADLAINFIPKTVSL